MNDRDEIGASDGIVEVPLGTQDAVQETTVIDTGPRSRRSLLIGLALASLLGAAVLFLLVPGLLRDDAGDPEAASDPEDEAEVVPATTDPVAGDIDDSLDQQVSAMERSSELPLFPAGPQVSLLLLTRDEVLLFDTEDGSRQAVPVELALGSDGYYPVQQSQPAFRAGESIVFSAGSEVFAVSFADGSVVEYGQAAAAWPSADGQAIYVLRGAPFFDDPGEEGQYVETYSLDHRKVGDAVDVSAAPGMYLFPIGQGMFSTVGGIYSYDDGFRRLSPGSAFVSGLNHVAAIECDDQLECELRLVDRVGGNSEPLNPALEVDTGFLLPGARGLSPTARHLVVAGERGSMRVLDRTTGADWLLDESIDTFVGVSSGDSAFWTSDGRYLVVSSRLNMRVHDMLERTGREMSFEDLGLDGVQKVLGLVERTDPTDSE